MLFQLAIKHKGIKSVVNNIKNNEIPSTPKEKLILKIGIQKILVTYWNNPILLLKKTHKKSDKTKVAHDIFNAIVFKSICLEFGIHNKSNKPAKGKHKV